MKLLKFAIGLCLGLLLIAAPLSQFQPSALDALETMTVQQGGRKKPLDTVAQETVAKIHGSTTYLHDGIRESSMETFLSLWLNNRNWNEEPFVLLSYRPLKEQVGLDPDQKHFSFETLMRNQALGAVVREAHQVEIRGEDLTRDQREAITLEDRLTLMLETVSDDAIAIVPHPTDIKGKWVGITEGQSLYPAESVAPLLANFATIKQTFLSGTRHLPLLAPLAASLKSGLTALSPEVYPADSVMRREVFFNHFHPFAKAWQLYGIAFIFMLAALWIKPLELYWSAIGLFVAGVAVQSYGFWLRMQIAGRPPVTNMYESVVWVGFGIAAIALIFELIYRSKYYLLAAAPLSVVCLILADSLPAVLDPSISPLVPVLRDNFWLSIHVPTIALSYASFALALGLGHVALGSYLFTPQAKSRIQLLSQLNYRVLQVGVLLLTTGIILGGIWAHFSWGRFWGWDPKETWALIALLCYLVPLHGRLVGWIGNFGISVASVVAFNAVLMAWYGVNFVLGTGLHSYGFGTGGSELVIASVVGLDLLFVLITAARYQGWLIKSGEPDSAVSPNPFGS
ncbi:cytochrome c biogenesis protein CcsA [Romeria aff. gracilis LEGE 07310]|uniref:Cytochrome c biogenesis protein CcsA n=1 Tax=Vasconcelosia minhoensis LEGE 07310 TaxID=915328 RepID=A0A8J7A561_9CYAN|nr:cytochrome c biogenesis protein CcsA [Romeria gracilis]MBE9076577.1 cytochrome c biogenesis protein CcsA [Romeria aff. gracilis LEGE 07310]